EQAANGRATVTRERVRGVLIRSSFLWTVAFTIRFAFFFTHHGVFRSIAAEIDSRFVVILRDEHTRSWNARQQEGRASTAADFGGVCRDNAVTVGINHVLVHPGVISGR